MIKTRRPTSNPARVAALCTVLLLLASAPVALAADDSRHQYTDRDSHPFRTISYFLHPVGELLEWIVYRPLHVVGSRLAPHRRHSDAIDHGCHQERPSANCTGVID